MANDPNDKDNPSYSWARYSEVAFIIPGAVVAGLILGGLLDRWLHTHWIYIAGVILGAIVGFIQLVRMLTSVSDKS